MKDKSKQIARLDNQLVMKAHYNLSTNEQKLVLFLASRIDTKREDFNIQYVKIKEIEKFFTDDDGKRWGSIYERVDMMCNSITDKKITLPKGFVINGKPIRMNRYIQWFTDIEPYMDDDGEISLKFQFAESLKAFLLELKEYVRINLIEVFPMRGKYAIRMYQTFKAQRDKTKKFKETSYITYGLEELKAMLGIGNKYSRIQNFKDRVLTPMIKEINEYSQEISINYELLKTRRKVTGIEFSVYGKKKKPKSSELKLQNVELENYVPTKEDVEKLSFSQLKAYKVLTKFGVYEGITYRQILPTIKGADMEGYEDVFCEKAIEVFRKKEKPKKDPKQSVAVFVNWWTNKKVFDIKGGDVFFQISDRVHAYKKGLDQERIDNREMAKNITAGEFEKLYNEQKQQKEND